jgi:hypothetical protein
LKNYVSIFKNKNKTKTKQKQNKNRKTPKSIFLSDLKPPRFLISVAQRMKAKNEWLFKKERSEMKKNSSCFSFTN